MKNILYILLFLSLTINSLGQDNIEKQTKPIVEEGKRLYRSEMASWYGTDIFMEKFKDRGKIGGYFSYSDNDIAKCVFFSKGENAKVIGTISFDNTYNVKTAVTDLSEREFTKNEFDLYTIRTSALNTINDDTLFKFYNNSNLNLVPIISNGEKKVYVLTGPKNNGVIIFGNDYLLTFDQDNYIVTKKQLHRNIIINNYGERDGNGNKITGGMHSHLPETGDFITSTDICTLMLYEKAAKWEQYYVISEKYYCIWNCQTDELLTMTKEAMDKIYKDQKKKRD